MRSFGIEEEFFLIDAHTGMPTAPSVSASRELLAITAAGCTTQSEFLPCQLESNSPILETGPQAVHTIRSYRKALAEAARQLETTAVGWGTPPRVPGVAVRTSPSERYRIIHQFLGAIAHEHYLSGLHLHIGITDPEEQVTAMNAVRRWLPTLTAIGANSPYWKGRDSGFASWRNIQHRRWSVQGIPPQFLDAADYEQRMKILLGTDVVLDPRHIGWGARISSRYRTLEIRVPDAQMNASNTVLLALIARALVDTSLNGAPPAPCPAPEALDVAQWQAAKFGLLGNHLNPATGEPTAAARMIDALMEYILPALKRNKDDEYVGSGLRRVLSQGTGASLQRQFYLEGGFESVLSGSAAFIAD